MDLLRMTDLVHDLLEVERALAGSSRIEKDLLSSIKESLTKYRA